MEGKENRKTNLDKYFFVRHWENEYKLRIIECILKTKNTAQIKDNNVLLLSGYWYDIKQNAQLKKRLIIKIKLIPHKLLKEYLIEQQI